MFKLPSFILLSNIIIFFGLQWFINVAQATIHFENQYKYILLWNREKFAPIFNYPAGTKIFRNCPVNKCLTTFNRNYFGGSLKSFDAILFDGTKTDNLLKDDMPKRRYPHHQYIFSSMESNQRYPVCNSIFDDFFNWSITYRLDSESPFRYFLIRNFRGEIIGPKIDTQWERDHYVRVPEEMFRKNFPRRNKTVAWFVSHCHTPSGRERFVERLQMALEKYGLKVHIFGRCGKHRCSHNPPYVGLTQCFEMLRKEYNFYLALENSFTEYYVTEKVLHALYNKVIPIVYGGADYSRFLPPGSYIDARKLGAEQLATKMYNVMRYPYLFYQYFQWTSYYRFEDSASSNACTFCATVHKKAIIAKPSTYTNFRYWWNPDYKQHCRVYN